MAYSVYQHWDPLKVCVVGRSYPPEFYSWITVPHVRTLFEKIAIETEEDFQAIIKKLNEFGVEVLRPQILSNLEFNSKGGFFPPPMTPRDYMVMIGDTFYENYSFDLLTSYKEVADPSWPIVKNFDEYQNLPSKILQECEEFHKFKEYKNGSMLFDEIFKHIRNQGNQIKSHVISSLVNGAMTSRIGKDLYFGTQSYNADVTHQKNLLDREFLNTRNHVVNTGGHSDGVYCPVCPGLIISLRDVSTYADTFPGWEVVYLPGQSLDAIKPFAELKKKNAGKWWIPGFEHDQSVIETVETWLSHWTGYVEETVFDVNMLIVDPKNVIVFNYNKQVFDAFERYGITPHIVPFRHRYFWDGGIHCVTSDLHREGSMQDFFPNRV